MDALILLAIIGWVVSALSKLSKRRDAAQRPGHQSPRGSRVPQPGMNREAQAPARPVAAPPPQRLSYLEGSTGLSGAVPFAEDDDPESWRAATWNLDDTKAQGVPEAHTVSIPGLGLTFDGDSVVNGVIYAEILGRRPAGRRI